MFPKDTLLRKGEVLARTNLRNTNLYGLIKEGKFPPPIKIAGGKTSFWHEFTINEWIAAQKQEARS